ncbi:MAG TPA: R3H domain-containing nucleic acid-binding protein [Thermoanaerobaculia bacterium]|jgi:spoIIIJ-associated protein|nr:R3H domain-containing nucleic acid-binding protein [Thermoanaerobaculia bacterium]
MTTSQRFEGHSLEEALAAAIEAFGVQKYQITHRVLVEKRGFLGGIKRVVIEAEVNEDATPPAESVAAPAPEPAPAPPPAPPQRESREPREPRESRGRGGRDGRDGRGGGRGGRGRRDRRDNDVRPGDFSRFAVEAPEQEEESVAASMVHAWCEQVISLAKLSVVVRTTEDEERIHVRLYGPDAPRFTDKGGELLDALQVLANKALTGRKVDKDIELDCEEFKQRRVTELTERARELADRVRQDGREQLLPAMTPIERRIVHLALQDDSDVTTESRGEGFYKRVAVIRRSQTEAAEVPAEATNDEP